MKYQYIRYISGEPGLGKTHWTIGQMMQAIHHADVIVFYVAPTIKLCDQVMNDLHRRLVDDGMTKKAASRCTVGIYSQHSGKGSIAHALKAAIAGKRDASGVLYNKVKPGSVVFMTHQGFFSLPDNLMSSEFKKRTRIFFDEAKKPVFSPAPLKLTSKKTERLFEQVFEFEPYKDTNFNRLTLAEDYERPLAKLRELISDKFAKQSLTNLITSVGNTRVEVFLSSKRTHRGLQFFQLRLPSRVFEGFEEVTLLSAFFEDSQLYYLLSTDPRIKLLPIGHQMPNYFGQRAMVKERYSYVTIVPLTTQQTVISKGSLRSMLIPIADLVKVHKRFDKLGVEKADHIPIMRYLGQGYVPEGVVKRQTQAVKYLQKLDRLSHNPIQWYMKQAKRIITAWKEKYEPTDRKVDRPLMFVNKMFEREVDTRFFHQVSTSAHGLNQYRHSNVAVFLAAINPDPQLAAFLKARIGDEYDIQRDYVLDACIQSLGRCSVRQRNLRDPILIILPDMKLAQMVADRMSGMPITNTRVAVQLGDMTPFTMRAYNTAKKSAAVEAAGGSKEHSNKVLRDRVAKWRADPVNHEIQKLRSKKTYYAKKLKTNPRDKVAKHMVSDLDSQLEKLLAKRSNT
ncbi:MAG: hypothetical protein ACN6OP_10430 [Pseudomonadales bacterium]